MIVAGTGHRPDKLGGYTAEVDERIRRLLRTGLKVASAVISGMALGFDMALAEVAIEFELPLTAAIPFRGQESMWPPEAQGRYRRILRHARHVIVVSPGEYAAWKMQKRNEWMVDHCDVLLALWDGSDSGTANCVDYANRMNRRVVNAWDLWEAAA